MPIFIIDPPFFSANSCTHIKNAAHASVQSMTVIAAEIPNSPRIAGIPPLAANILFMGAYIAVIHICYAIYLVAASFLYGSYGHPQVQTVPSTAWGCSVSSRYTFPSGLARRFCMNSILCHTELDNSLAMELKESGF